MEMGFELLLNVNSLFSEFWLGATDIILAKHPEQSERPMGIRTAIKRKLAFQRVLAGGNRYHPREAP
jgi:hypothetical protein